MEPVANTVTKLDHVVFHWCMSRKHCAEIAAVARKISKIGDGYLYVILIAFLFWLEARYGSQFAATVLLAFAFELPLYLIFKNTVKRHRPNDAIQGFQAFLKPSDKFSFPSGHTAAAFLFAYIVAHYYPAFAWPAFTLAGMIGASRVLLGVHFPTDILAGIVLGVGSAEAALYLLN